MSFLDYWSVRLAVICVIVFFLQLSYEPLTDQLVLSSHGFLYRPWTLVTSIFAHGGFEHLFYNMFALLLFGTILESIIGGRRWLIVFFVAGILGGIAGIPLYDSTLGASGAIFGLMGALAVLRPRMTVYLGWFPVPMAAAVLFWAAGDLLGLFVPSGIANAAHLVGLAAGLVAGWKWRPEFGEFAAIKRRRGVDIPESRWREWEDRWMH